MMKPNDKEPADKEGMSKKRDCEPRRGGQRGKKSTVPTTADSEVAGCVCVCVCAMGK